MPSEPMRSVIRTLNRLIHRDRGARDPHCVGTVSGRQYAQATKDPYVRDLVARATAGRQSLRDR
jgi:hypothetical protein